MKQAKPQTHTDGPWVVRGIAHARTPHEQIRFAGITPGEEHKPDCGFWGFANKEGILVFDRHEDAANYLNEKLNDNPAVTYRDAPIKQTDGYELELEVVRK